MATLRRRRVCGDGRSVANLLMIAVVVVGMGGTAAAATSLVSGDTLIKQASLSGNRLRKHTIGAREIDTVRLGKVRAATTADRATEATTAIGLARIAYHSAIFSVPGNARATGTASCDPGTIAVGGGDLSSNEESLGNNYSDLLVDSHPSPDRTAWQVTVENDTSASIRETAWAVCLRAASGG